MAIERLKYSPYQTKVERSSTVVTVYHHRTPIIEFNSDVIVLRNGGWQSVTTKRKLNAAAKQWNLGFSVYQKDFTWYVTMPNGETTEFESGMRIYR